MADLTNKWTGKNLSYAGRVELIRSVLQGTECYWLQVFPLPANVIDRISSLARNFLWGSKRAPVAWKDCCLPLEEGGLGLRNLGAWNNALLSKILWNVHKKADSLWIKWIHNEFIKQGSVWTWQPKEKDSPLLKKITTIRDQMLASRNSEEIAALWDKWYKEKGTVEAYDWFRPKGERAFWAGFIWKPYIPPKFSFTTWQAIRRRLPTRNRLAFLQIDPTCPLCGVHPESNEHLFFLCPKTLEVWLEIKRWLGLRRNLSTIASAIKWIHKEHNKNGVKGRAKRIGLITTISLIWKARNSHCFDGKIFDPNVVVFNIKKAVYTCLYSLFPSEKVTSQLCG